MSPNHLYARTHRNCPLNSPPPHLGTRPDQVRGSGGSEAARTPPRKWRFATAFPIPVGVTLSVALAWVWAHAWSAMSLVADPAKSWGARCDAAHWTQPPPPRHRLPGAVLPVGACIAKGDAHGAMGSVPSAYVVVECEAARLGPWPSPEGRDVAKVVWISSGRTSEGDLEAPGHLVPGRPDCKVHGWAAQVWLISQTLLSASASLHWRRLCSQLCWLC